MSQQPVGPRFPGNRTTDYPHKGDALADVCRELAGRLDEQAVVDIICKYARQLIGADGACVIVREGELVHYACEDAIAPLWQGQRFPITNCISGWSILHDAPAIIEDIYNDDRIPAEYYRSTFVNSLAMMPIHADNPIGAIGVYWRQKLKAGERQLELLERLADIAGIALMNAQLFAREQETRRLAETANRLKDDFLATVSHELRTPLNAILGWASLIDNKGLDQETLKQAHEAILRNAKMQDRLVRDLLDVSRIITGKMSMEMQNLDLAPILRTSIDSIRAAAQAKMIRIETAIPAPAGMVLGDMDRLQQVFWNLLSNAVKFTPQGGRISVESKRIGSEIEVIVSDTGDGISSEFLPYIFDRFRQQDSSITRKYGGLGLGLAIARHLVELQGGRISAESGGENRGATFRVRLPLVTAQEPSASS